MLDVMIYNVQVVWVSVETALSGFYAALSIRYFEELYHFEIFLKTSTY